MTREISNKMASGELTSIKVGGTAAGKEVALVEDIPSILTDSSLRSLEVSQALRLSHIDASTYEGSILRVDNLGRVYATPVDDFSADESTVGGSDTTVLTTTTTGYLTRTISTHRPSVTSVMIFSSTVQNTTGADITLTIYFARNSVAITPRTYVIAANSIVHVVGEYVLSSYISVGDTISIHHRGSALGLVFLAAGSPTLRVSTARPTRQTKSIASIVLPANVAALTAGNQTIVGGTPGLTRGMTFTASTGKVSLPSYAGMPGVFRITLETTADLGATAADVEAIFSILIDTGAGDITQASSIMLFGSAHLRSQISLTCIVETYDGDVSIGVKSPGSTSSLVFTNYRFMIESLI